MNYYLATWVEIDAGDYVPPDGCGGGYYKDKRGEQIIPATSKRQVRSLMQEAFPRATRINVKRLES